MQRQPQVSKKINQKIEQLQNNILKYQTEAKAHLLKSQSLKGTLKDYYKKKCLMALQKKKRSEEQLKAYCNHSYTVEMMKLTTQQLQDKIQMINTMQHALRKQQQAYKGINLQKIQQLQDQMSDIKFRTDYLNQMMNKNYEVDFDSDDQQVFRQYESQTNKQKKKQISIPNVQVKSHSQNGSKNISGPIQ